MLNNKQICPHCGRMAELVISNNPLTGVSICYDCINKQLDYQNLEHAEFFCRTYNLPWEPDTWLSLIDACGTSTFREYTLGMLDKIENQPNLHYSSTTRDLWSRTNKEWEKCRSFVEILDKLQPIKESYITRGRLKWGDQYTFEELIKLDSIYTRTLKANNVTNPLQKEAVKTLCKLQIEMDEAIRAKDAKAIKDFASAWSTFSKQADLETMIQETHTDEITTVSELYDYMERQGFKFRFYDNNDRDEVDFTIKDIQETNRNLILESTGLQSLLEELTRKRLEQQETAQAQQATEETSLDDLLNAMPDENSIDYETDDLATNYDFGQEDQGTDDNPGITSILREQHEQNND